MNCIDCGGAVTVFSPGKPHERGHCHQCGSQVFKGLRINRKDWERWVNGEAAELVGRPVVEQLELI
jgi:hypothetical protein